MAAATQKQAPPNTEGHQLQVLIDAGCDPSVIEIQKSSDCFNKAPVELLAEFLRCLMSEEYNAARILCNKGYFCHTVARLLELEPDNSLAKELVTTIDERLQLDEELETESDTSSSSISSVDSDDDHDSSVSGDDDDSTASHHCCNHSNQ